MSAYLYIAKLRVLTALTYRFEVFSSIGTNIILMFASIFLWKTAYKGFDNVAGLAEKQMVTYAVISILLSCIFVCNVENTINGRVRNGEIATDFIKPVNLLLYWLMEDVGESVSAIGIRFLPLLAAAAVLFRPSLPSGMSAALLFPLSCVLSFLILWLMSSIVGMLAFWTAELGNMGIVKDVIVRMLSGSIVPLWFFPKAMQKISVFLPFQYTYQTPLGIYIGRINPADALKHMGIQLLWIALLWVLLRAMWKKAGSKLLIQGG